MSIPEPTGVVIHDPRTDTLRSDATWLVLDDDGRPRVLHLRVARGKLVEPDKEVAE